MACSIKEGPIFCAFCLSLGSYSFCLGFLQFFWRERCFSLRLLFDFFKSKISKTFFSFAHWYSSFSVFVHRFSWAPLFCSRTERERTSQRKRLIGIRSSFFVGFAISFPFRTRTNEPTNKVDRFGCVTLNNCPYCGQSRGGRISAKIRFSQILNFSASRMSWKTIPAPFERWEPQLSNGACIVIQRILDAEKFRIWENLIFAEIFLPLDCPYMDKYSKLQPQPAVL